MYNARFSTFKWILKYIQTHLISNSALLVHCELGKLPQANPTMDVNEDVICLSEGIFHLELYSKGSIADNTVMRKEKALVFLPPSLG